MELDHLPDSSTSLQDIKGTVIYSHVMRHHLIGTCLTTYLDTGNSEQNANIFAGLFKPRNVEGKHTAENRNNDLRNPTIINLSHLVLSDIQTEVQNVGLKYMPTSQTGDAEDIQDR